MFYVTFPDHLLNPSIKKLGTLKKTMGFIK